MARMYPTYFDQDTDSSAERRLFESCQRELDDNWTVFHHVKWVGTNGRGQTCDGETDFVIAHPNFGVFIIEVKGGRIRFDEATGHFFSTNNKGIEYDIKDPFEQAVKGKHNLIDKLRGTRGWPNGRVPFIHIVAFPDMVVTTHLRLNAPRAIIIDSPDLALLKDKLMQSFQHLYPTTQQTSNRWVPLGKLGVETLKKILYQSGTIRNPLLAESILLDEQILVHLTEKQLNYLRFLQSHRRAVIAGCAGSGKTFLAVEKARQLVEYEQKRVLFTCFNQALANYIGEELGYRNLFDTFDFHQLCIHYAKKAGIYATHSPTNITTEYFETGFPDLLMDAINELGSQYDAIIVDEGQDFRSQWWEALPWLLHDPSYGYLYIFCDDNQRIYPNSSPLPIPEPPFHLDENCRNTQRIANLINQFYTGTNAPKSLGPEGLPVQIITYHRQKDGEEELRRLLHKLTVDDGFDRNQIAVLTTRGTQTSHILNRRIGNIQLADHYPLQAREMFATTVRKFKGLEKSVVVLCEVDDQLHDVDIEPLMYIGTSRAKAYLVILTSNDAHKNIKSILSQYSKQTY